ncbi:MAG: hypothetical protein O7A63_00385, partial [Acidobacteria bacterium]|nr:hypothetical protein [Acidobacteriota bacterium]
MSNRQATGHHQVTGHDQVTGHHQVTGHRTYHPTTCALALALALGTGAVASPSAEAQTPVEAPASGTARERPADLGFRTLPNGLRYRCVHVPGSEGVCAVLGIRAGTHHD